MALFVTAGCTAVQQRVERADNLATAGIAFADMLPPLYDEYFQLSVDADTLVLESFRRPNADVSFLKEELEVSNKDYRETAETLRGLRDHGALLGDYFNAISVLADSDVADGIAEATKGLVDDLKGVRLDLSNKTIAGTSVDQTADNVTSFAVAAFKNRALKSELEARGKTIAEEISLHHRLLAAIADDMRADLKAKIDKEVGAPLENEFTDLDRPLPADWPERRAAYLIQTLEIQAADSAAAAARTLQLAWKSYAAGSLDEQTINSILTDIEAVTEFLSRSESSNEDSG